MSKPVYPRTATLTTTYVNGTPQPAELTSYYFGGAYEVTGDTIRKYYSFAGQTIAVREYNTSTPSTSTLSYLLTDHLGSVVAITNASGTLTSQQRYLPFGGQRTNVSSLATSATDYGYTGQKTLDEDMGGLMDYKARFYSSYINHFLQPDTLIPDPSNPQAWNRYSYVGNNPIQFNDPTTGHMWDESGCRTIGCSLTQKQKDETAGNEAKIEKASRRHQCWAGDEKRCSGFDKALIALGNLDLGDGAIQFGFGIRKRFENQVLQESSLNIRWMLAR